MESYDLLESTVRNKHQSVIWSHKIQEKQADIYTKHYTIMEISKLLAAALTSAGLVSLMISDQFWIKLASALLSFVSTFINTFFKSFNLPQMVSQHKTTANNLVSIRDDLELIILQIHMRQETPDELYFKYEKLVHKLDEVYAQAPNTTPKAVKMAQKALHITKDNTFTDQEIDQSLPAALRKGNIINE